MTFSENNKNILTVPKYENNFIYFLLNKNEVVYVGQTQHGLKRPLSHTDKVFDEIKILYCEQNQLNILEDIFIQKYKPLYNKQNNYAIRWSLSRVRNSIRKQTGKQNFTVPKLKKILKKLNIQPQEDIYSRNKTISFDEYKLLMQYVGENSDEIYN